MPSNWCFRSAFKERKNPLKYLLKLTSENTFFSALSKLGASPLPGSASIPIAKLGASGVGRGVWGREKARVKKRDGGKLSIFLKKFYSKFNLRSGSTVASHAVVFRVLELPPGEEVIRVP